MPRSRVRLSATLGGLESVTALVVAHLAAGGELPPPVWLAAFAAIVYAASSVVLRERAPIRIVLPGLLAAQVLGHAWLVTLAPAQHSGHLHATDTLLGLTPAMVGAHLLAAGVTGLMWVVRRRAVEVLVRWAEPGVVAQPASRRAATPSQRRGRTAREHRALAPTRGPPARAVAIV